MTENKNFVVYHMPGMLDRVVTKPDPNNPAGRIRDDEWYESTRQKMYALFEFFKRNDLIAGNVVLTPLEEVVLRINDFSGLGQKFIMSQAPDKWLASFDRPGSKKDNADVTYLEKQLAKLKG